MEEGWRCLRWESCYTSCEQVASVEPEKEKYRPERAVTEGNREGKGRTKREMAGLSGRAESREEGQAS